MSLDHHADSSSCAGTDWVMASYAVSAPMCALGPHNAEICSAWDAYDYPPGPNTDGDLRPNGPNIPGDDATWPISDHVRDECDNDDDADGMPDHEVFGTWLGGHCQYLDFPTSRIKQDTDGDHLLDTWECLAGSNPLDPNDRNTGTPSSVDSDGDGVHDYIEQRGYDIGGHLSADLDLDGCSDLVEIASVDGNRALTAADWIIVARRVSWPGGAQAIPPEPVQDYVLDMNKSGPAGVVNSTDQALIANWLYILAPPPC